MKKRFFSLVFFVLIFLHSAIHAQNLGPELLTKNNFGTIQSEGMNGDNPATRRPLYYQAYSPAQLVTGDSIFYQPPTQAYYNNWTVNSYNPPSYIISINPYVTIAPPLPTNQTAYLFGFNEAWYSNFYTFLKKNGSNSAVQIPMAPNNGYYVVATSTNGMYGAPTLGWGNSWFTVYDRYEVNRAYPINYFLIVNADFTENKVFYQQPNISVTPGHIYRMSADLVNLSSDTPPNVVFFIGGNPVYNTGIISPDNGAWKTYKFDYIAPCDKNLVDVSFSNDVSGSTGNDLALDNLSLKEILPQITMSVENDCPTIPVITLNAVMELEKPSEYTFTWYKDDVLQSSTGQTFTVNEGGNYYYRVTHGSNTCNVQSKTISIDPAVFNCNEVVPKITAFDDLVQALSGVVVSQNIITDGAGKDCNTYVDKENGGLNDACSSDNLNVFSFTIPSGYGYDNIANTYTPGTPIVITDDTNATIGVLNIQANGDLTFQEAPDYTGSVSIIHFSYTVIHTVSGATSTANVDIPLKELPYNVDESSCAGYPVQITFTVKEFLADGFIDDRTGTEFPISDSDPAYPTLVGDPVAARFYLINTSTGDTISTTFGTSNFDPEHFKIQRTAGHPELGGSITITFTPTVGGLNNFELYSKQPYLAPNPSSDNKLRALIVELCPRYASWTGLADDFNWQNPNNWAVTGLGSGYPNWCTDVIIMGDTAIISFPIINKAQQDICRDITFEPGASVGKIQDLIYRAAYVQYKPIAFDQWTCLSAPLKYMYANDFTPDNTWTGTSNVSNAFSEIKSYMRLFDLAYSTSGKENPDGVTGTSIGSFSKAFSELEVPLTKGFGFASGILLMDTGGKGMFTKDSTFYFPRFIPYGNPALMTDVTFSAPVYQYHNNTGAWLEASGTLPRGGGYTTPQGLLDSDWGAAFEGKKSGEFPNPMLNNDSPMRFVYESDGYSNNNGSFSITLNAEGATRLVGNPLMSHLDFDKFQTENSSAVQPWFRLWDGTKFYTYIKSGSTGSPIWAGMTELASTSETIEGFIAPMQGFFVDVVNATNTALILNFNTDMSTSKACTPTSNYHLRAANTANNLLKLRLKMQNVETVATVASILNANDHYDANEDIYKLFSFEQTTPEIYTIADKTAIEIQAISQEGDEKLIPIGIKGTATGNFELNIEGGNSFDVYEQVLLKDAFENKDYDLRKQSEFSFEKTASENLEGRFYIHLLGSIDATSKPENSHIEIDNITIVHDNGVIRVYSPTAKIDNFELYDISGRLLYRNTTVNSFSYSWNATIEKGIYLVRVQAGKRNKVQKIKR
ncbi:MAG: T9SS type A sorting domain-containing protein [Prevotellaceae bacterium]|jgi:hypothetical protein|nr:T9SS type A sorting domain-containing protein [Prevotellaceae bacterium]